MSIIAGVTAAALWGMSIAAIWVHLNEDLVGNDRFMAATLTVVSVFLEVVYSIRDRDKDALVRAMADFTLTRGQAPTAPLRRVV